MIIRGRANQLPIADLAYIAGVIDSDGYIGVKRGTNDTYQAVIAIKQVESGAIDLVDHHFPGHRRIEKPSLPNGKSLYSWQRTCRKAAEICLLIEPWLRIKRNQALNAIKVQRLVATPRRFELPDLVEGEPMVTCAEAAEYLGLHRGSIDQACRKGSVPFIKVLSGRVGFEYRIPRSYLAIWKTRGTLRSRPAETTAALQACFARAKELNRVGKEVGAK